MAIKLDILNKALDEENRTNQKLLFYGGIILLIGVIAIHEVISNYWPILFLISCALISVGYIFAFMPNDKKIGQIEIRSNGIKISGSQELIYTGEDIKEMVFYKGEHNVYYNHGTLMEYLNEGINDYVYIKLKEHSHFINVSVPKQKFYDKIKYVIHNSNYKSKFDTIVSAEDFVEIIKSKRINKYYS